MGHSRGAVASRDIWWPALAGNTLVGVSALALSKYSFVARYQREDNRAAATHAEPADLVSADAPYAALNLD